MAMLVITRWYVFLYFHGFIVVDAPPPFSDAFFPDLESVHHVLPREIGQVFDVGFGACFQKDFDAGDEAVAGCIMQRRLASASGAIIHLITSYNYS